MVEKKSYMELGVNTVESTNNQMWHQGPVVQSVVSLTSSLVVKMLTVLVNTISNRQVFFAEKMWVAFADAKATHIFSTKIFMN